MVVAVGGMNGVEEGGEMAAVVVGVDTVVVGVAEDVELFLTTPQPDSAKVNIATIKICFFIRIRL